MKNIGYNKNIPKLKIWNNLKYYKKILILT